MKLFLNFVCVALPLLSVVNSTVSTNTQLQATIPDDLFTTFSALKQKAFSDLAYRTFLTSLTGAFLFIAQNNLELDNSFKDLIREVKFLSIIREMDVNPARCIDVSQIAITNAKKLLRRYFFSEMKQQFSSCGFTAEQIALAFQKYFAYFEWDNTILLFTHSLTVEYLKAYVVGIIQHLKTVTCGVLIEALIEFETASIRILHSHYCDQNSVFNLAAFKKAVNYEPTETEFGKIDEIISFFMDYFTIINGKQEKIMSSELEKIISQALAGASNGGCMIIQTNMLQFNYAFQQTLSLFNKQLKKALKKYSEQKYLQLRDIFNEDFCRTGDKIVSISNDIREWDCAIDKALSEESLLVYPESTIEQVSANIREMLRETFVYNSFYNSVCVAELLLSYLMKGQWKDVIKFAFGSFDNFIADLANSKYCKEFSKMLPGNCYSEETAMNFTGAMVNSSQFYMIFRFNYKLGVQLAQGMRKKRVKEALADEKCAQCRGTPKENDPFVIPICSCQYEPIHASCYAKKMMYDSFQCKICNDKIYSEQFKEYLRNYDISIAETLAPAVLDLVKSITQSEREASNSTETFESRHLVCMKRRLKGKEIRNCLSIKIDFSKKEVKEYLTRLVVSLLKSENESLKEAVKRLKKNLSEFLQYVKPHYKLILNQMKKFVKEYAIKEIDFDESWPVFEKDWWQPLKELTEDDLWYIN